MSGSPTFTINQVQALLNQQAKWYQQHINLQIPALVQQVRNQSSMGLPVTMPEATRAGTPVRSYRNQEIIGNGNGIGNDNGNDCLIGRSPIGILPYTLNNVTYLNPKQASLSGGTMSPHIK